MQKVAQLDRFVSFFFKYMDDSCEHHTCASTPRVHTIFLKLSLFQRTLQARQSDRATVLQFGSDFLDEEEDAAARKAAARQRLQQEREDNNR